MVDIDWRRLGQLLAISIAAVLTLALVIVSPILLSAIAYESDATWARLSSIGQAYGSISALLAALALLGVAISTIFQLRQTKMVQIQLFRDMHIRLLTFAMEDPETYVPAVSSLDASDGLTVRRRLYIVLNMNYYSSMHQTGYMKEAGVRTDLLAPMFESPIVREVWRKVRPFWVETTDNRKGRRFLQMVDDEHAKAVQRERLESAPRGDISNATIQNPAGAAGGRASANTTAQVSAAAVAGTVVVIALARRVWNRCRP